MIHELRPQFPLGGLLKVAGLSKSTYSYIANTWGRVNPDRRWERLIQFIYRRHKGRLGYRRITAVLQEKGYVINYKKVLRLMNKLGLQCVVRVKKYKSYRSGLSEAAPNMLDRHFTADRPNQKWTTDVTEFKLFEQKLYLSPILDLYNGEIVTYTLRTRPTAEMVLTMMEKGLERVPEPNRLMVHSDQGWHYRIPRYQELLKRHQVTQSMSRKGNCYDNAVIESFFAVFKSEFLYLEKFEDLAHFETALAEYIDYYNHDRIKSRLAYKSPVAYRLANERVA